MPNPEFKTIRIEFSEADNDTGLEINHLIQDIETELAAGWFLYGKLIHYSYTKPTRSSDEFITIQVWMQTLVRNYVPLEEGPIGPQGPQGPQGLQGIQGNPGPSNHGSLTGLSNDDHLQYIPVNASRGFSNPVSSSFPIHTDHLTTMGWVMNFAYPLGSIFISVNPTNPATYLGFGTWTIFGQGRVLIGVDPLDVGPIDPLNTSGLTGGFKQHTLTVSEMPSHTHTVPTGSSVTGAINQLQSNSIADITDFISGASGGGGPHQNLPPYITVYMWRRHF